MSASCQKLTLVSRRRRGQAAPAARSGLPLRDSGFDWELPLWSSDRRELPLYLSGDDERKLLRSVK